MTPSNTPGQEPMFAGTRSIVTGGTGSLGLAVVRHIAERGGAVVVPVFKGDELARLGTLPSGVDVTAVEVGDLADGPAVDDFYAQHAGSDAGGLWASIHIAGGFAYAPIEQADARVFEQQMRMNAFTCYHCCRAAIAAMRAGGSGGRIVNVAAKPALHPHEGANMAAYTASKAAVIGLTGALAEEVKGDDIWVNAVVPSIMDTRSNRAAMPDADHAMWSSVQQVSETVCWLASSLNQVTRGALVPVYGRS
ncbi:MAG: SDR family NAD(P)-dependent oxidoreductase [Planctomycetota bacterium]